VQWGRAVCESFRMYSATSLLFRRSFVESVQNGHSVRDGKTFEQYLGPMFKVLQVKYWEWLNESYSTYPPTKGYNLPDHIITSS